MKEGKYDDGELVLRAKIDMASPNLNMRDPALFRIKHEAHQATGDDWCIYPMYDFSHPISDATENITHSLCTLEFEDHRPFYDWVIEKLVPTGLITATPQQIEFSRLNVKCVCLCNVVLQVSCELPNLTVFFWGTGILSCLSES
jgi:glutaminyl-tRNA synthetase